jgi:hypothetical protein
VAKVKVLVRPLGGYNGEVWPEVGETIDLPDHVAEGMAKAGNVELVKTPAKTAAAKPNDSEKRPASAKGVETRKA